MRNKSIEAFRRIAVVPVVALVLFACGGEASEAPAAAPSAPSAPAGDAAADADAPVYGGVLKVALSQTPPNFDVLSTLTYATQFPMAAAYNLLIRHDPDNYGEIVGDLAESWEWLSETKIQFNLRQNVRFHSGIPFTSADVKYSFERIASPPVGISSPRRSTLANVDRIDTPSEHVVVVTLKRPQEDFLDLVATPFNVIYPEAVARPLDATGDGMKFVVDGTGPFKLQELVEGQVLILARNDDYFKEGLPYLDGIEYYKVPPGEQTRAALQTEQIDATWFIPSPGEVESMLCRA